MGQGGVRVDWGRMGQGRLGVGQGSGRGRVGRGPRARVASLHLIERISSDAHHDGITAHSLNPDGTTRRSRDNGH